MNNQELVKTDFVRSHLVCEIKDNSVSKDQITEIAKYYGINDSTARKMADDLLKCGFLQKVGANYKIRSWILRLVNDTPKELVC